MTFGALSDFLQHSAQAGCRAQLVELGALTPRAFDGVSERPLGFFMAGLHLEG